jgi:hypothetical protein
MNVGHILHAEMLVFLGSLAALLCYRLLTRQITLDGLISSSLSSDQVSPERVQLLLATLLIAARYLNEVWHSTGNVMPDVSKSSLTVIGASSGIYATLKGFAAWRSKSH